MNHILPPLLYEYAALEPHIDAKTMKLHHDKHHATYVDNLNSALVMYPELQERSALWLLLNVSKLPEKVRSTVRNNAGGHVNHSLFWRNMSPAAGTLPSGALADAINRDFGSLDQLKSKFAEAGSKQFASGWVWLAREQKDGGGLQVYTTAGHDNPLTKGHFPILVNDVWEHAYYLKHQNRRQDYLNGWWPVVNWREAARLFERSDQSAEQVLEGKLGATQKAAA